VTIAVVGPKVAPSLSLSSSCRALRFGAVVNQIDHSGPILACVGEFRRHTPSLAVSSPASHYRLSPVCILGRRISIWRIRLDSIQSNPAVALHFCLKAPRVSCFTTCILLTSLFIYYFALNWRVLLLKVWLVLLSLCLDQPRFKIMSGRPCLVAQLGIMVVLMNNNVKLALLKLYLH
jgi:hypothetical protein